MKHILENLKLFYVNHGGQASDLNGCTRIHQVLKKIATLPLGGGGEDFVISFTKEENVWSSDYTILEIKNAYDSGKKLIAKFRATDLGLIESETDVDFHIYGFLMSVMNNVPSGNRTINYGFAFASCSHDFIFSILCANVDGLGDMFDGNKTDPR